MLDTDRTQRRARPLRIIAAGHAKSPCRSPVAASATRSTSTRARNASGGVVQHPLQLFSFAHRALRSRNHGRSPRWCRRHSKFVHAVCSVHIHKIPTNAARSPRRLVPTRPAARKPDVEGQQTVEQTGLAPAPDVEHLLHFSPLHCSEPAQRHENARHEQHRRSPAVPIRDRVLGIGARYGERVGALPFVGHTGERPEHHCDVVVRPSARHAPGTTAAASGAVLRTTARSTRCTSARSIAAAASTSRSRRRRSPEP